MGKMNISIARTKAYAKEQRTMNNEYYPKQTQSNPIPAQYAIRDTKYGPYPPTIRNTQYEIRNTKSTRTAAEGLAAISLCLFPPHQKPSGPLTGIGFFAQIRFL
jgi:hypothetical protein